MSRFKTVASAWAIPVALAGALSLGIGDAEAQISTQFQRKVYSAKFMCGTYEPGGTCLGTTLPCQTDADCPVPGSCVEREGPVKPGNYQTAINIVNPTRVPLFFLKKAVLLFDDDPTNPVPTPGTFEEPQPPGQRYFAQLQPNWGMEIDCPDIRTVLLQQQTPTGAPLPFIKGYVVLETFLSYHSLDVVAAYTTHGFTPRFGDVCTLPGSPLDGLPCDPADPADPCLSNGGTCASGVVGSVPEGFSIDVEKVPASIP